MLVSSKVTAKTSLTDLCTKGKSILVHTPVCGWAGFHSVAFVLVLTLLVEFNALQLVLNRSWYAANIAAVCAVCKASVVAVKESGDLRGTRNFERNVS